MLSLIKSLHKNLIFFQRIDTLSRLLSPLFENNCAILDIGCGDGSLASSLKKKNDSIIIQGIDVQKRNTCFIPCIQYDGRQIPYENDSFDYCLFVDVLHHTLDNEKLLKEAARVTKKGIIIKDHICESKLDFFILKCMDWVGNRPYNISLPYNYKSKSEWFEMFNTTNLEVLFYKDDLHFYPSLLNKIFGRNLHFIAKLKKEKSEVL